MASEKAKCKLWYGEKIKGRAWLMDEGRKQREERERAILGTKRKGRSERRGLDTNSL